MNAAQLHLALTHVPVILSFTGLALLLFSFFKKNDTVTLVAFYILLAGGLFAIPVYFTGEGTEEIVGKLPGVSDAVIEEHEEMGSVALGVMGACGLLSLIGILTIKKYQWAKVIKIMTLLLSLVAAGVLAQTAHLGGQIRHTEIRSGFTAATESGGSSAGAEQQEKEDD